jgi:hypothetical protein
MKNKTAMQELLEWIRNTLPMDLDTPKMIEEKIESLLIVEREQIVDAHGSKNRGGFKSHGEFFLDILTGEQYYNETYGKE